MGLTEATWDERKEACCKKRNVWDTDPTMHACATVPDLADLDWPPVRLGWFSGSEASDHARGCPDVEPRPNEPAPRSASC